MHKNSRANRSDLVSGVTRHQHFSCPRAVQFPGKQVLGTGISYPESAILRSTSRKVLPRENPVWGVCLHWPVMTTVLSSSTGYISARDADSIWNWGRNPVSWRRIRDSILLGCILGRSSTETAPQVKVLMTRNNFLFLKKLSNLHVAGSSEIPHWLPRSQQKSNSLLPYTIHVDPLGRIYNSIFCIKYNYDKK